MTATEFCQTFMTPEFFLAIILGWFVLAATAGLLCALVIPKDSDNQKRKE